MVDAYSMYNNLNINAWRDFSVGQRYYILEYLNCLGKVLQFFLTSPHLVTSET